MWFSCCYHMLFIMLLSPLGGDWCLRVLVFPHSSHMCASRWQFSLLIRTNSKILSGLKVWWMIVEVLMPQVHQWVFFPMFVALLRRPSKDKAAMQAVSSRRAKDLGESLGGAEGCSRVVWLIYKTFSWPWLYDWCFITYLNYLRKIGKGAERATHFKKNKRNENPQERILVFGYHSTGGLVSRRHLAHVQVRFFWVVKDG